MKKLLSLLCLFCVLITCVACANAPSNFFVGESRLYSFGYAVDRDSGSLISESIEDKLIGDYLGLIARRDDTDDTIYAIYFTEIEDARTCYEEMKDMDAYKVLFSDLKLKKKGHWVMIGTDDAIDDLLTSESCA